jgi:hypothetical protein
MVGQSDEHAGQALGLRSIFSPLAQPTPPGAAHGLKPLAKTAFRIGGTAQFAKKFLHCDCWVASDKLTLITRNQWSAL